MKKLSIIAIILSMLSAVSLTSYAVDAKEEAHHEMHKNDGANHENKDEAAHHDKEMKHHEEEKK